MKIARSSHGRTFGSLPMVTTVPSIIRSHSRVGNTRSCRVLGWPSFDHTLKDTINVYCIWSITWDQQHIYRCGSHVSKQPTQNTTFANRPQQSCRWYVSPEAMPIHDLRIAERCCKIKISKLLSVPKLRPCCVSSLFAQSSCKLVTIVA